MKFLFIGDVVGEPGRRAVREIVPRLRAERGLDLVIANGENSAGGSGITSATAKEMFDAGVDIITSGDHLWDQKEVTLLLKSEPRFVRPINYPEGTEGRGVAIFTSSAGWKFAVLNAQGRTFMPPLENPFLMVRDEVEKIRQTTPLIFLDMHAEATSEKIAMARMLDGKVTAVIGTHTHVPTSDEQVFPGGTAFLCDAGFTGAQESILGREIEPIIKRFVTNTPQRFHVARTHIRLHGAIVEADENSGRAISIERVAIPCPAPAA